MAAVGCFAYRAANNQSITSGTWTPIQFDTEVLDTDAIHSTTANTSRFTVPSDGYYLFVANAIPGNNAGGAAVGTAFAVDGATATRFSQTVGYSPTTTIGGSRVAVHAAQLTAGQYVEAMAYHGSTTPTVGGWCNVIKLDENELCHVRNANSVTATSGTPLLLDSLTEVFDVGGMHSDAVNPSRITAQSTGNYLVWAGTQHNGNATGHIVTSIYRNGVESVSSKGRAVATSTQGQQLMAVVALTAGDYLQVYSTQDSGGDLARTDGWFGAMKIPSGAYMAAGAPTATQSINTATWTSVNVIESIDTDTMHSNATNPSRITFTHAGTYFLWGQNDIQPAKFAGARILFDGATNYQNAAQGNDSTATRVTPQYAATRAVTATQYAELQVYQESGAAKNNDLASRFFAVDISTFGAAAGGGGGGSGHSSSRAGAYYPYYF